MYLSKIIIKNFRCFGEEGHEVKFNKGLNVIVGENDSGKSAILDAIRFVLGTTDQKWQKVELSDFYREEKAREIEIKCVFSDLTDFESAAFLECLTHESNDFKLYINWHAKFLTTIKPNRIITKVSTGKNGDSGAPTPEAKELLRVTYLRALRDSYNEMQSGKNSRLSQIVDNIAEIHHGIEYSEGCDLRDLSLSGIVDLSNELLANHNGLMETNKKITGLLKSEMLLKSEEIKTQLTVAGREASIERKVVSLLERLDLSVDKDGTENFGKLGLGTSNIMSMACELLLDKSCSNSTFLLIEEPEAHIHAQRQVKFIKSLKAQVSKGDHQIFITTHSPLITSVVSLNNIILVKGAKAFPMTIGSTMLEDSDYQFLERYLDATKANLFFAKSVLIVEGPGEELLLPTIATILGRDFADYGVSVVNVMSTGLRRYARIFQRRNPDTLLDIKVACVADRDVMPDCAPGICINEDYVEREKWPRQNKRRWRTESEITDDIVFRNNIQSRTDGQNVKTFVSEEWTLEYDLAYCGLEEDVLLAIAETKYMNSKTPRKETAKSLFISKASKKLESYATREEKASYLYSFFSRKDVYKAEFSQQLAFMLYEKYANGRGNELLKKLPKYLVDAIGYVTEDV